MSTYETRNIDRELSNAKLKEVAELGATIGHWTIKKTTLSDGETWRFVEIETPAGLHFELSGGGWNAENKIRASVGSVKIDDVVKAYERDVRGYSDAAAPDAYISKDKTAAQILKDIMRRVINNPDCINAATKINERIAMLQASTNKLAAHVEKLQELGFSFRDKKSSYSLHAYHRKFNNIQVYEDGRISLELSLSIGKIEKLLALLDDVK